ncbi:bifunctional DNA primase/polymerase [Deinococcus petrolearius]|uniref:Bifunctional DNA primase/polymerase n=1 Tax=Deinococcus petrolearius TaxID=1751295 RepID=A0ABW1DLU0_9DEIO
MPVYENEPKLMHREARKLVALGIPVIPTGGGISPKAKEPHHEALKGTGHCYLSRGGERRSTWKVFQERLPTEDELEAWYLEHRARGIGFVTGRLSGRVVVDVDPEGLVLLSQLGWRPHVLTPSGGAHFYVPHPGWYVPSNASKNKAILPPGFDIRGDGGYVMYPPSRTRKGSYRRTDHRKPLNLEDIPERVTVAGVMYPLREALGLVQSAETAQPPRARGAQAHQGQVGQGERRVPVWLMLDRAEEYAPTSRNRGAFMFGLWMHANDYTQDEALRHAREYVERVQGVKRTAFTEDEARQAVQSAYRYPRNEPWKRRDDGRAV